MFPPFSIATSNALPGWTVLYGSTQQSQITYNDPAIGSTFVTLYATNGLQLGELQRLAPRRTISLRCYHHTNWNGPRLRTVPLVLWRRSFFNHAYAGRFAWPSEPNLLRLIKRAEL